MSPSRLIRLFENNFNMRPNPHQMSSPKTLIANYLLRIDFTRIQIKAGGVRTQDMIWVGAQSRKNATEREQTFNTQQKQAIGKWLPFQKQEPHQRDCLEPEFTGWQ